MADDSTGGASWYRALLGMGSCVVNVNGVDCAVEYGPKQPGFANAMQRIA